ncbi:MAG: hypothetical protein J6L02_07175 [Bacteroidales bacterium]|nr:hypothetical protein [Bacteroidales bacterium]
MKNKNLKFVLSVICFIFLLLIIDFVINYIGESLLVRLPDYASGQIAKDNFRLNRIKTDIIIVGSSRGVHHYNANQLCDSINNYIKKDYTLYNASLDGKFLNSNLLAVESILNRHTPKLLILETQDSELYSYDYADVSFSSMHYYSNNIVKKYIDNIGWKEKIKNSSSLFRYNQKILSIIGAFSRSEENKDNGYLPLFGIMKIEQNQNKSTNISLKINSYTLNNLYRVLDILKKKNIPIVIATSPKYKPTTSNKELAYICSELNIPYIDLCDQYIFNSHAEYFQDSIHLNYNGAQIYTDMFFEQLKPYLKQLKH